MKEFKFNVLKANCKAIMRVTEISESQAKIVAQRRAKHLGFIIV